MKKVISTIGVIMALAGFVGVCWSVDNYFAHERDVAKLEKRLDDKILSDRAAALQERAWKLEDRYNKTKDPVIQLELRRLIGEIEALERQMKAPAKK